MLCIRSGIQSAYLGLLYVFYLIFCSFYATYKNAQDISKCSVYYTKINVARTFNELVSML